MSMRPSPPGVSGTAIESLRHGVSSTASSDVHDAVVLRLRQENGHTVLRVPDRGPGVPAAYRERIFEPFFRMPGSS
jgi:two-component system, OmpR family, sensor kinase